MNKRIFCLLAALMILGAGWAFAEEATPTSLDEPAEPYQVGDRVTFGSYEQDNNLENGSEPVEWIVLQVVNEKNAMSKKVDHRALLLSVYALDSQPYNATHASVTWRDCSLRSWLNEDFLQAAFSAEEQEQILKRNVDNNDDQGNSSWADLSSGGNGSQDCLFLLSYREAFKLAKDDKKKDLPAPYFADSESRVCLLTDYAAANGAWADRRFTVDGRPAAAWWLRSPGKNQFGAAGVFFDGSVFSGDVTNQVIAVRPAFWMNLEEAGE